MAPSPTDLDGARSEFDFQSAFEPVLHEYVRGCGRSSGCEGSYYSHECPVRGVRVIVLDDTGDVDEAQLVWLQGELAAARSAGEPAIVIGHANLQAQIAEGDGAASQVAAALVAGGASAYFFDATEQNVQEPLRSGGGSIPTFGSGTLGYVNHIAEETAGFIGASGFLLAQVNVAARNATTNVAPVSARLIPNVGELAVEARDGTLLRRSHVALFAGLARRPRSGNRAHNKTSEAETSPYIPIPDECLGSQCSRGIEPEYTFTSSRPEVGDFVARNLQSADPRAVKLASNGKPIPDSHSGVFCAYNAGTTMVTLSTGGRAFSLPVTVQAGSVRQPCGTVPLNEVRPNQTSRGARATSRPRARERLTAGLLHAAGTAPAAARRSCRPPRTPSRPRPRPSSRRRRSWRSCLRSCRFRSPRPRVPRRRAARRRSRRPSVKKRRRRHPTR